MANGKNQPFNVDEWLESKKKGLSGKIPRADFISKIKELVAEVEQLKADKDQLATKNKELQSNLSNLQSKCDELEEKSKTSQTELQNKDNKIAECKASAEQIKQELTTKLAEQEKTLQSKEEEIKNLQQRPDITDENYQELLNNQEKHQPEDLKPNNLPTDWEQQLSEKKTTEEKLRQIEAKLIEVEKRPTSEELTKAVQEEKEKFKDYIKLTPEEQEKLNTYESLKAESEQLKKDLVCSKSDQPEESKTSIGQNEKIHEEEYIKKIGGLLATIIKPLYLELEELKKQLANNSLPTTNSETSLPADYKEIKEKKEELLKILKTLNTKII